MGEYLQQQKKYYHRLIVNTLRMSLTRIVLQTVVVASHNPLEHCVNV